MTRYPRTICAAILASSFFSFGSPAQVARRLAPLSLTDASRVTLPESNSGRSATAEHLGSLLGDTTLTGLSLVLKPTEAQAAELAQLLVDQQNPASPSYRQWLTPERFGSMGYSAGPGYDLATGLGSVSAPDLRAALQMTSPRQVTLSLRASPQRIDISSVQLGMQFSVILDVLGKSPVLATGRVILKVDGVAQTASQMLFNGEFLGFSSLDTLGAHTIDATYAGDANYDGGTASITVTPIQATPQISATSSALI